MSDDSHYPDIDDYDDSVAGDWLCLNSASYRTYQCQPSPLAKLSTSQVVNFQLKLGGAGFEAVSTNFDNWANLAFEDAAGKIAKKLMKFESVKYCRDHYTLELRCNFIFAERLARYITRIYRYESAILTAPLWIDPFVIRQGAQTIPPQSYCQK